MPSTQHLFSKKKKTLRNGNSLKSKGDINRYISPAIITQINYKSNSLDCCLPLLVGQVHRHGAFIIFTPLTRISSFKTSNIIKYSILPRQVAMRTVAESRLIMITNIRYCPHCNAELDADTEIFLQGREVIGCENCVRVTWADFEDDDEDDYEDDYLDGIYDEMKIERCFG